ncbi:hypothetical protein KY289_013297 [Solanum tuberosum]|nr:hypothetical protein KY289_013297 [Solanum tuberosum]
MMMLMILIGIGWKLMIDKRSYELVQIHSLLVSLSNLQHHSRPAKHQKQRLLTTNEIVQAIECDKGHLIKLIGVQQPVAPLSEANRQFVEEQPVEEQPVEALPFEDQLKTFPLKIKEVERKCIMYMPEKSFSFLGTLARNATLCLIDIFDWRSMDTKQDLWEYTKFKARIAPMFWLMTKSEWEMNDRSPLL